MIIDREMFESLERQNAALLALVTRARSILNEHIKVDGLTQNYEALVKLNRLFFDEYREGNR